MKLVEEAGIFGIELESFMKSDFRIISHYKFGKATMIEADINRDVSNSMFEASKIAQAVWGDKKFKDEPSKINITNGILNDVDYEDERKKKINRTLKRIQEQYGIELRR